MNTKILLQLRQHLVTDQTGKPVLLAAPPKRIVCLVPSITELLFDLGLGDKVAGITKFCIHPPAALITKVRIGGTKNIQVNKIRNLKPDLIIASKEENLKEPVEILSATIPVYTIDVKDLPSAMEMILAIGKLTGCEKKALAMVQKIEKRFAQLNITLPMKSVLYYIWKDPYYSVGGDTFISAMLQHAGFKNIYSAKKRYPEAAPLLQKQQPDFVFLSSEPYPFKEKHRAVLEKVFPKSAVVLVDGSYFSWYGSRLLQAPAYFKALQKLCDV